MKKYKVYKKYAVFNDVSVFEFSDFTKKKVNFHRILKNLKSMRLKLNYFSKKSRFVFKISDKTSSFLLSN